MADSPAGWVEYGDYLGLAGDELKRLEDEAMARAQADEGAANQSLRQSQREAATTGQQLTGTMSYNDYLAAKKKADASYQAVGNQAGHDWRARAAQKTLGLGSDQRDEEYDARAMGAEQAAGNTAAAAWQETLAGQQNYRDVEAAWNQKGTNVTKSTRNTRYLDPIAIETLKRRQAAEAQNPNMAKGAAIADQAAIDAAQTNYKPRERRVAPPAI